jgi:hypothetical protein
MQLAALERNHWEVYKRTQGGSRGEQLSRSATASCNNDIILHLV